MYYSIIKTLLIYLCFYPFVSNAGNLKDMRFGDAKVGKVISVYDADTFRVNIDDWPTIIGSNIPVRVRGVDAPEIRGKCEKEKEKAKQARNFTVSQLEKGRVIELLNIQRGKYFRLIADVYIDGKSLSAELQKNNLVRIYHGGTRASWCI